MKTITILIPAYNEEEVLPSFKQALDQVIESMTDYQFDYLFINDGSSDKTQNLLEEYAAVDSRVKYIELSRNFGKETAMLAGFDYAEGDAVIIIDADLQHPPEVIEEFVYWWSEGFEDVFTVRKKKVEENPLKRFASTVYYRLLGYIADEDVYRGAGDFRLLDRKCVEALQELRENERNTKGLYSYIGFRKKGIEYEESKRAAGDTKWKLSELIKLAIDGITSHSTMPLRIWSMVGLVISFLSFIFLFIEMIKAIFFGSDAAGYPTMIAAVVFLGGIQLISLGVIGEYLARVFVETKERSAYFVREASSNFKESDKKHEK